MDKILSIGRAEYLQAVRSKAFLIGLFLMPVLMGGSIAFQILLKDQVDLKERRCAVVDPTGELFPVLEARLEKRNESVFEIDEDSGERVQKRPLFRLERYEPAPGEDPQVALSKRAKGGDLQGFVLIGELILSDAERPDGYRELAYHTEEPTFGELPDWLESQINGEVRRRRFEAAEIDQELVAKLDRHVRLTTWGLAKERDDGTFEEAKEENELQTFGIPVAAVFLLFMLVMTSAPQLMNQVLEEKMQRISEVLVSAVTPFQLMLGKLLGSAGVSLTLALVYLGGVFWATHHFHVADMVPNSTYVWFVLMMLFSLLMYGSLFSALGSACSELRDAQSMMMPAMIIIMVPFFAWSAVLESPNGTVAVALTYFPTATPMIFLIRLLAPPGPPTWELFTALAMCVATTLGLVWASGKIFRVGVLSQGQTPTFGKLLSWIVAK